MAPDIALKELAKRKRMTVLDPMSGSGTTATLARYKGHKSIAFDTDPLAVMISKCWSLTIDPAKVESAAKRAMQRARTRYKRLKLSEAYPKRADAETKAFIRYWFDSTSRRQLACLAHSIDSVRNAETKLFLWCAFSRLVITKQNGVSLAMDVSHSRPHRVYETSPVKPFDAFEASAKRIAKFAPFRIGRMPNQPAARIAIGDARKLPLRSGSVDLVITSPPYLNAIDYLRGHKLSLVWIGKSIRLIRAIRARNVGCERGLISTTKNKNLEVDLKGLPIARLSQRDRSTVSRYAVDMSQVLSELFRVLRTGGTAVLVLGDCSIKGVFFRNSTLLRQIAHRIGFRLISSKRRPILASRRYLPPPSLETSGSKLQNRMKYEVILKLEKKQKKNSHPSS